MPALKNFRHEEFVRQYIEGRRFGWSIGDAYQRAGYRTNGHAAEVNGSKLLKRTDIQARIAELGRAGEERAKVSVESLLADFDAVIAGASRKDQWGAVNRAMELRGKLKGFLVDRLEVGGPGEFDGLDAPEAVLDAWISQTGSAQTCIEQLEKMIALLRERALVHQPVLVEVLPPRSRLKPGAETSAALAILRPGKRH